MKLFVFVLLLAVSVVNSVDAACSPFTFSNGSKISFADASHFVGWFPQMAQSGGGNYDWGMSLCDATIQATGAPACAKGDNMVMTSQCAVPVAGNPTISAMADGTGVVLSFPRATQADNNIWANTINCVCDPTKNNLNSPSNAYAVTVNLPNIGATWYMSSNGCCVDGSGPVPSSTPSPAAFCTPFTFINGSVVSLSNYAKLAAEFTQMTQQGAGGSFDWAVSLCAPQYQAPTAPACAVGSYMSRASSCTAKISALPTIAVSHDGYALQFKFPSSPQTDGYTWANVVTCLCDRSALGLVSPTNSYSASVQGAQVNAAWTLTSDACCVELPSNTTSVPSTTSLVPSSTTVPGNNTCTAITFPNGSKISWGDPTTMSQYWPSLQQVGDVVGTYPWSVSLCDATIQAAGAMSCAKGNYMAQNPDCSFMFTATNTPTIAALGDGTGVAFTFAPVLFIGNTWSAAITCVCDPDRDNLYLPSGNYKAAVSGTSGNVISLTWNFQSKGCCIDSSFNTTTTTVSTATTVAPTTTAYPVPTPAPTTTTTAAPITGNQCKKVTFANGSYVPFTNYKKLTGFFPSIQQYGINPHTTSWSLSLCDPSIVAPSGNGQICNPHSYLSENGCETIFPQLSFQTRDQNLEVGFTYIRLVNATVSHYAYIYCACDPTAQNELKVPSNSYNVFSDPTGDLIEMWRVSSVECCAINPNRSTTATATTTFVPSNTSSSTTTWIVPNNTDSTTTSTGTTTTPAPSGSNNNNNNNSPGGDNNGNGTSDVKVFGFAAAGAAVGVIIVGCLFFFVRWICTRKTDSSVDAYRSAYEQSINDHNP